MKFEFTGTVIANTTSFKTSYRQGERVNISTEDFKTFGIKQKDGTYDEFTGKQFFEVFATNYKVNIPIPFLPDKLKEQIYREVLWSYTKEDVLTRAGETNIPLSDKQAEEIAWHYAYEAEGDCELSYWDNIDNLIAKYLPTLGTIQDREDMDLDY